MLDELPQKNGFWSWSNVHWILVFRFSSLCVLASSKKQGLVELDSNIVIIWNFLYWLKRRLLLLGYRLHKWQETPFLYDS